MLKALLYRAIQLKAELNAVVDMVVIVHLLVEQQFYYCLLCVFGFAHERVKLKEKNELMEWAWLYIMLLSFAWFLYGVIGLGITLIDIYNHRHGIN
jgi:hypothetical protein